MTGVVSVRLASERVNHTVAAPGERPRFYTPGEVVTGLQDFMRGHGTYVEDDSIKSSVAGVLEKVNKLVCVRPLKARYAGEVGDVVVGRVAEVQQRRWKVETNSRLDSVLQLSSVNLPGGELRRRSVEDEQMMRQCLQEGDLISAEVQSIFSDGSLALHTRSLKYGKLSQGTMVKVFPSLVRRSKNHFHDLPCGVSLILGNNGFIWISPPVTKTSATTFAPVEQTISREVREAMSRVRNCIAALAASRVSLHDASISLAFETSLKYEPRQLLQPEAMLDVAFLTQLKLRNVDD